MGAGVLRFEVYGHGGEVWFRLVDADGHVLLFSGAQSCVEACLEVVAELKTIGRNSARYRIRTSPAGTEYFTVHGVLGDVLATSRLYGIRRDRDTAEQFVREHVCDAPVAVLQATLPKATARVVAGSARRTKSGPKRRAM